MTGPGRSRWAATVLAVAVTVIVAFGVLVVWDGWFVNYDGSFYLALARNLRHGVGYVFPDRTPATFRGPGYPGVLALAWLVLPETARSAVWVTRLMLVVDAGLLVVLVRRWGGSPPAALVAGVLVAVQPAVLVSGARPFYTSDAAADEGSIDPGCGRVRQNKPTH